MDELTILNSILLSTKKSIGIMPEATEFDTDIILAINTVFGILSQIGIGVENYSIVDETDLWTDFIGDFKDLEMVKTYVSLKVGLLFDPPQANAIAEIKKQMISELEWRLSIIGGCRNNE